MEIAFVTVSGADALRYGALRVSDAEGQPLPARLSVDGSTLSIWIEDAGATYPIEVQATLSGLPPSWGWRITFGQTGAEFGFRLATAGDVDGDGYSDVIVGAPYYDGGQEDEGGAFLYYGSRDGLFTALSWITSGGQAHAHYGRSVATAGDVNGDGCAEVTVGTPDWDGSEIDEGGAWVYYGSKDGLSTVAGEYYQGHQAIAAFGISVATAGDVNGDGFADIIIGAPLRSHPQLEEGFAMVYCGSATGLSKGYDWRAESNQAGASLGQSVATAGDVNGDGYADIIVGAHRYDDPSMDQGKAFVWYGSAAGPNGGVYGTPANADWSAKINQSAAGFGWSVSTAGDVNGDGYADVIVGAPYYTNGEGQEGGAWLYLGSSGGLSPTAPNSDEGYKIGAHFGWSVGTAGDVNGDGRSDVIVGAPHFTVSHSRQGRAWVWHDQPTPRGISATRDWDAAGDQADARFGFSVFTAGDVNGDGYSDIIIGAPGHASGSGRAYVYYGAPGILSETPGWTKRSNQKDALFGLSVGTAGDVNGDGYADVIVGAPRWDGGQENEGAAWAYLGQATGLASAPHWYKRSNNAGAEFGWSVGTAGDVNGDGYSDVIVGAPRWHVPERDEGAAFVYAGSASGLNEAAPPLWSKASNQVGAQFGTSVGTAGDVNGDGYADIIVGAPFWQSGGENRGAVWLYYGSAAGPHSTPDWFKVGNRKDAQYGYAVGTAGDVNGDGYSDVIVGSPYWYDDIVGEGRAWVYLGSRAGLRSDLHWHAEGNSFAAHMGHAVGTAGDVNGDGYSDVIVGAPDYGDDGPQHEGKVWVFHGSASGLSTVASWAREGGRNLALYGWSVGTAGDVNGDGYSDIIVAFTVGSGGQSNEGRSSLYHGSPTGLKSSPAWSCESDQTSAHYGYSVGTAGDVNGDGYADVIIGAPNYQTSSDLRDEGRAYVYYGNGGGGTALRLYQFTDEMRPLAHLGRADTVWFRVGMVWRNPFGRGGTNVEIEAKPLGVRYTGQETFIPGGVHVWSRPMPGDGTVVLSGPVSPGLPYHWRLRVLYNPATTPWMPASRWVTIPWNGWHERDLRTAGGGSSCRQCSNRVDRRRISPSRPAGQVRGGACETLVGLASSNTNRSCFRQFRSRIRMIRSTRYPASQQPE